MIPLIDGFKRRNAVELSIIIVNYRAKGLLQQCLRGIQRAALPFSHEVIVVDNASGDTSTTMVRNLFPEVCLVVAERNDGLAHGNNLGMQAAHGKFLMFLNPDIAVFEGSIETLRQYLADHPEVGLVGPRLMNPDGTTQAACYRFPTPLIPIFRRTPLGRLPFAKRKLRAYLMLDWNHDTNRPVDWVLGACIMTTRAVVDAVGLMDERFFLYYEDVDWCRRIWRKGWQVHYVANAVMVHYHQRLSAENPGLKGVLSRATRIHIASGVKYFLKYAKSHDAFITPY